MVNSFIRTDEELHELALCQMESRQKSHLSDDQKRLIVQSYLTKNATVIQLSKEFDVAEITIYRWIRKFASGEPLRKERQSAPSASSTNHNPSPMPRKRETPEETPEQELERLRCENRQLQEALKMAEWSNHAKDVMIDLAEKTFNIPIRKKSGAKQ